MGLHPAAAVGFARAADAYERGRPDYPPEAAGWLCARLGLGPGRVAVDLAAGTGKLTRELVTTGAEVIAVEPVAEMRAAIDPRAAVMEGTAEAIPLDEASADGITVAQAFHWFEGGAALAEIHRVLRPGGALALIWNRRVLEDPVNRAVEAIIAPHRRQTPAHRVDAWRAAFARTTLFGPLEERSFPNAQVLDADGLADRVCSTSFIASLSAADRGRVLDDVRALVPSGPVTVRYETEVQVTQRR